jgi:hypothetical protein
MTEPTRDRHEYRPTYDTSAGGENPPTRSACSCGWRGQWWPTAQRAASSFAAHIHHVLMQEADDA